MLIHILLKICLKIRNIFISVYTLLYENLLQLHNFINNIEFFISVKFFFTTLYYIDSTSSEVLFLWPYHFGELLIPSYNYSVILLKLSLIFERIRGFRRQSIYHWIKSAVRSLLEESRFSCYSHRNRVPFIALHPEEKPETSTACFAARILQLLEFSSSDNLAFTYTADGRPECAIRRWSNPISSCHHRTHHVPRHFGKVL